MSKIKDSIILLLEGLSEEYGLDIKDVNFKDTPDRVERAYAEIFSGIKDTRIQIRDILLSRFPSNGVSEMIISKGNLVYSVCPHHLLPVRYVIDIAYIPGDEWVLGISKLARIAEVLAKRPVLQETMTEDIGKVLDEGLETLGVGVKVEGKHFCVKMRGAKQHNSSVITSYTSGAFRDSYNTRMEFLKLIER